VGNYMGGIAALAEEIAFEKSIAYVLCFYARKNIL
jgi:hypothetical protein